MLAVRLVWRLPEPSIRGLQIPIPRRIIHSAKAAAMNVNWAAKTSFGVGLSNRQRPSTAAKHNHIPTGTEATARTKPVTLACMADHQRPRTKLAQAVDMPQVGHRIPNSVTLVQAGKPNDR